MKCLLISDSSCISLQHYSITTRLTLTGVFYSISCYPLPPSISPSLPSPAHCGWPSYSTSCIWVVNSGEHILKLIGLKLNLKVCETLPTTFKSTLFVLVGWLINFVTTAAVRNCTLKSDGVGEDISVWVREQGRRGGNVFGINHIIMEKKITKTYFLCMCWSMNLQYQSLSSSSGTGPGLQPLLGNQNKKFRGQLRAGGAPLPSGRMPPHFWGQCEGIRHSVYTWQLFGNRQVIFIPYLCVKYKTNLDPQHPVLARSNAPAEEHVWQHQGERPGSAEIYICCRSLLRLSWSVPSPWLSVLCGGGRKQCWLLCEKMVLEVIFLSSVLS